MATPLRSIQAERSKINSFGITGFCKQPVCKTELQSLNLHMQGTILSQISGEEPKHRPLFLALTAMQIAAFSESSIDVIITGENLIKG